MCVCYKTSIAVLREQCNAHRNPSLNTERQGVFHKIFGLTAVRPNFESQQIAKKIVFEAPVLGLAETI